MSIVANNKNLIYVSILKYYDIQFKL